MASRDQQRGRLTILAATLLLIGTGIFAGAAHSLGLPGWYRALLLGVAAVMVLSAGALVLRTVSLERGLRSNLPAPKAANPGGDSLEDLMGSVSLLVHDIRNSLAGLSGVIEILGRDLPASSGGKEIIEEARHEIRHIDEAVADFRARIETRTANPDPTGAGSPVKEK